MAFLTAVGHWFTTASNWTGPDGILARALAQIELSTIVIAAAALLGIGLGFVLGHSEQRGFIAVNSANTARAVPSLTRCSPSS